MNKNREEVYRDPQETDNVSGLQERNCLIEVKGGKDAPTGPSRVFWNLNCVNALSNLYGLQSIGVGRGIETKTSKKNDWG